MLTPAQTNGVPEPAGPAAQRVRKAAVAGLFYPKEPEELSRTIDRLLAAAPKHPIRNLKAIVCPHAGYDYSGATAAHAYKAIGDREFRKVVLLAPSHNAFFEGVSVCAADVYETPLGRVPISATAKTLAKLSPFVAEPRCPVQRPPWAGQASRGLPAGEDTPETWEHSGEVQVPFLQQVLQRFELVSLVMGETDPVEAAHVLAGSLDEQTLIVASSDLSHDHPYDEAERLDRRCIEAICALDFARMQEQEACGKSPILTVMHLARVKGWRAALLDYRNSGDTGGDRSGVVGYAAVAFYAPAAGNYTRAEQQQLLALARRALTESVKNGQLPQVDEQSLPAKFREPSGCFITITKQGELRGCIGHLEARVPLYQSVMENARNAALRDTRFAPVEAGELNEIEIEISVLSEPEPLLFSSPEDLLNKLQPHRDGVILKVGGRSATFLPQVWEQLPDKTTFLERLSAKAGQASSAWREPATSVEVYQVELFREEQPGG